MHAVAKDGLGDLHELQVGKGVDDFFAPEINSPVVPLNFPGYDVAGCHSIPDPTATGDWTKSFQNIQCYDKLKVQAILNQISGRTHR